MKDMFYVDDESGEDLRRAWKSGTRVIVLPSRRRHEFRHLASRILRLVADGVGRTADQLDTPEGIAAATRASQPRPSR
jgi:hypothetical protein